MPVHWEIGNIFSAMFKGRSSTIERAQKAVKAYREIPIKFMDFPAEQALKHSSFGHRKDLKRSKEEPKRNKDIPRDVKL